MSPKMMYSYYKKYLLRRIFIIMASVVVHNDINPLIDALLYCKNLANDTSVCNTVEKLKGLYPESADEITSSFEPLVELEKRLNAVSKSIDPGRLHFFFDVFDETDKNPRGANLANALMMPSKRYEAHAVNMRSYTDEMKALSMEERLEKLRLSFSLNNELWYVDDCKSIESFFDYIAEYPVDDSTRMNILLAIRHYPEYLEELYEMLCPIVETIECERPLYAGMLERFRQVHSGISIDELIERVFEAQRITAPDKQVDVYELYPRLFTIEGVYCVIFKLGDDPLTQRFEINVLYDLISGIRKRDISLKNIADCIKVLGNPTRLEILTMLRTEEVHVQGLVEKLGLSFNTVSHHMTKLMLAGLVEGERRGNFVYYHASIDGIRWLMDKLNALMPQ